jgi:hypothetical protein
MAMDYQSALYDPIYATIGEPGIINGVEGFTVLDKTGGLEIKEKGQVEVQTIACAAVVRSRELQELGVALTDLENGTLIMSAYEWRIESYRLRPSPKGQRDGEVLLLLSETSELSESESDDD